MRFQFINNVGGWLVFAVALVTYWLTFEETASYWDCGEFIAVAYKLEVSHPPGAPMYMLLGRLFSFLAFGDVTKVAYWINSLSVVASAFTILFLFWTITLFGRKLLGIRKDEEMSEGQVWMVVGAALVGSLAYTWSESFWFSAVEAEVYAMSAFFTAFVVWAILKWDVIDDEATANRWLIFIAYVIGLSIGVHMLNLVTIPALGLIYYFKKYTPSRWGIIAALGISGALVIFINDFIVPGLPSLAAGFEVFFVNNIGLPFGSGVIIFMALLIGGLVYGIVHSQKKNKPLLNTFLLSTSFILIGYCSYATIVIRSNFDTPINENAPKDVMSFVRYLKREQYGSRPLLYGTYFTADLPIGREESAPVYTKGKDNYEITDHKYDYIYEPGQETILPRAWNPEYKKQYMNIMGLREGERPTFTQNIVYMFRQQIGRMYMRYFMWNFAGRESDIQDANWLGPFDWFEKVPKELAENRARNNFFMIPFVLGFIGMYFQFVKDTKNFAVVGLLFVMTGVAIVVYLNSPPVEPRERDYIYSGSTYAFTIWIGFAVIALATGINGFVKNLKTSSVVATVIALSAPFLMAVGGWDDHNRSDRFFSVDSGKNFLSSCDENGILFTGGDNDTFMLWYAQEVEEHRTDVRVIVFSYYNTDWYIAQSMLKQNKSEPFKYTLSLDNYKQGGPNDVLYYADMKIASLDLRQYLELLKKNYTGLRFNDRTNMVPSKVFTLNVNREEVLAKGIIPKGMENLVVDQMRLKLKGNSLEKKDLAFLDLLATSNWDRPIYLNFTSLSQLNIEIRDYVVQEGNAYRVLPVRNNTGRENLVNVESSYKKMIKDFGYRGLDNPKLYFNEDYRGFVQNHRGSLNSVAEAMLDQGDTTRAREVLNFSITKIPDAGVRYDITTVTTVELLFSAGEKVKAAEIAVLMGGRAVEMIDYELGKYQGVSRETQLNLYILAHTQRMLYENGETEKAKALEADYLRIQDALDMRPSDRRDY